MRNSASDKSERPECFGSFSFLQSTCHGCAVNKRCAQRLSRDSTVIVRLTPRIVRTPPPVKREQKVTNAATALGMHAESLGWIVAALCPPFTYVIDDRKRIVKIKNNRAVVMTIVVVTQDRSTVVMNKPCALPEGVLVVGEKLTGSAQFVANTVRRCVIQWTQDGAI